MHLDNRSHAYPCTVGRKVPVNENTDILPLEVLLSMAELTPSAGADPARQGAMTPEPNRAALNIFLCCVNFTELIIRAPAYVKTVAEDFGRGWGYVRRTWYFSAGCRQNLKFCSWCLCSNVPNLVSNLQTEGWNPVKEFKTLFPPRSRLGFFDPQIGDLS